MNKLNIHNNLEKIKIMAKHYAVKHKCRYTVILTNPDEQGNYEAGISTYEFVRDSYFEKESPFAKTITNTDEY